MNGLVIWFMYKRLHRRLLESVGRRLPADEVQDVALGHRWKTIWPTMFGVIVLSGGLLLDSNSDVWLIGGVLVAGFGLLLLGWLATPATLIVNTSEEVVLINGRRRTYEPVDVQRRFPRSSWGTSVQVKDLGLWIPALWKRHLPPM